MPTTWAGPTARWHSVHLEERGGEFLPARDSQLFVDMLEVVFDGSDRDDQFAGYLLVRVTGGSQQRRLLLGPSELRPDIDGEQAWRHRVLGPVGEKMGAVSCARPAARVTRRSHITRESAAA